MSTTATNQIQRASLSSLAISGALAGLAGGVVFGIMMGVMGMLPMVGMLVGQENALIGSVVHLAISAFIGAVYGVIAGRLPINATNAFVGGIVNGVVWWVLGALILMPLYLGMTHMVFVIGQAQWMSLLGHILYGLVTSFAFISLAKRS